MPSIGGLVSGLDTATIISQLMQLEAIPQTQLMNRVSDQERAVTSLQTVNAKLASIVSKAEELVELADWSPTSASSSNEHVTTAADDGAVPVTFSFKVDAAARSHQITSTGAASGLDQVVTSAGSTTVDVKDANGAVVKTFETGDGTLDGLIAALNAPDTGYRATTIRLDDGTYRLNVTSTETGADTEFTLAAADGTAILGGSNVTVQGADAVVSIGTDQIHSSSNTFSDVVSGVDFTVSDKAVGSTVTVTVNRNSQELSDKVKSLVDAVNFALSDIESLTAYDVESNTASVLTGDSTLRNVRNKLVESVIGGVNGQSLAPYGIEIDRDGKLVFDEVKFEEAYEADPVGTAAMFAEPADPNAPGAVLGFVATVHGLADSFSDSLDGTVTLAIKGREQRIDRMEDDIADWDIRLEQRRVNLERQYAALEVALGQMQNQSQWLSGAIAGLPPMLGSS